MRDAERYLAFVVGDFTAIPMTITSVSFATVERGEAVAWPVELRVTDSGGRIQLVDNYDLV
jgi:hypothetical protein